VAFMASRVRKRSPKPRSFLQTVEPAFARGLVPAVALAAHGGSHTVFLERLLEGVAGVLSPTIGVMEQPRRWLAGTRPWSAHP
jgi:hypothetical protein